MDKQTTRRIDSILDNYPVSQPRSNVRLSEIISVLLLSFGFLGIIWSIPFPQLNFLGSYNGFINWASFLIAFTIYYYYRLSPVLSYGALLMVFAFSAAIVALEKLQNVGLSGVGYICLLIFAAGFVLQYLVYKSAGKTLSVKENLNRLLIGPIWLLHFLFRMAGLRY